MDLIRKKTYSFSVYAPETLGNIYQNALLLAEMDFDTALQSGIDLVARHQQIYPKLPVGTPKDPRQYDYYKFQLPGGTTTILGEPWIVKDSITEIGGQILQVQILGKTAQDITRLRNALLSNDFLQFEITVQDL